MTANLPADVRAEAAKALELARQLYDNAALYPNASDRTRAMVNAVTAVVAEEIARPLQARVAELEGDLDAAQAEVRYAEAAVDGAGVAVLVKEHRVRGEEVVRLQARVEEQAEELAFLRGEAALIERDEARVEVLTAALTEITNAVVDWNGDPGPAHVMVMDAAAARARAALAAGKTESAPLPLNESGEVPLSYFSKPGTTESEAP